MIIALAGGVGGAKLVHGLAQTLPPERLLAVVNTGDDFTHLGLPVCPDLDTVMYTLAGLANPETGWGIAGESWRFMDSLGRLGGETWFRLGDQDLATHVRRKGLLGAGLSLSAATRELASALGVRHRLVPATDDPLRTRVTTDAGEIDFQDYFVRQQCRPTLRALRFEGAAQARPSPAFAEALADPALEAVVICPSNPYLSIDPVLAIGGVREALTAIDVPVIAVSPIVGGQAIKGPAAKIMRELGREPSALEVARHYRGLVDGLVIDTADAGDANAIAALGMTPHVTGTVMKSDADRASLASEVLALAARLRQTAAQGSSTRRRTA